ncbi:hypothetical protein EDD11_005490 [Mortierella claussenii]|nr:hypothetical protein EDD11_005490 [Mortierella claussenii]
MEESIPPHRRSNEHLDVFSDTLPSSFPADKADTLVEYSSDTKEKDPEDQQVHNDSKSNKAPRSRVRTILLFFGMFLGAVLASLEISIVATALPRIASDFDAQSQMAWIATVYLLAYTAFQPIYGRFTDIFGRKQMFLFANVLFLIGSAGSGAAPSMAMLILFRGIQGLGGSGLFSIVLIMVTDMFENIEERARYQSLIWLAFAVSGVTGPLLGGALVEHVSWRWCFYINLPLGVLSIVLVAWLYQVPFERSNLPDKLRRIDYLGVFFVIASVLCLLLPLTWGGTTYPWNSATIIVLFCVCAVLGVILIYVESKAKEPVIPPALFLNRNVALALFVNGLIGICFMGLSFYLPLYFQSVLGASTTNSGLRMIPCSIAICMSTIGGSFLLKYVKDYRIFICTGTAVMTLGIGIFILFDVDTGIGQQLVSVLVMGLGQGLIFQNCMLACQECAGDKYIAVATALCGFINSIGSAMGVAICAAAFNNGLVSNLAKLSEEVQQMVRERGVIENMNAVADLPPDVKVQVVQQYANAFQFLFIVLTPIMGIAFLSSLFLRRRASLKRT